MKTIRDFVNGIWEMSRCFLQIKESVESLSAGVNKLSNKLAELDNDLSHLEGRLSSLEKILIESLD